MPNNICLLVLINTVSFESDGGNSGSSMLLVVVTSFPLMSLECISSISVVVSLSPVCACAIVDFSIVGVCSAFCVVVYSSDFRSVFSNSLLNIETCRKRKITRTPKNMLSEKIDGRIETLLLRLKKCSWNNKSMFYS